MILEYNLQFFAKDGPGGEKTEPATQKKLDDARKEGQVAKSKEIAALLDEYVPGVEELMTKLKKTSKAAKEMRREITDLKKEVNSSKTSTLRQLELEKKVQELDDLQHMVEVLRQTMDAIPAEILAVYKEPQIPEKGEINRE